MTADLSALIARLEAAHATGIIMESEAVALCRALGLEAVDLDAGGCEHHWDSVCWNALKGSLDAALALAERVLEGPFGWTINKVVDDGVVLHSAALYASRTYPDYPAARTPALALCIAILRAKQGEGE